MTHAPDDTLTPIGVGSAGGRPVTAIAITNHSKGVSDYDAAVMVGAIQVETQAACSLWGLHTPTVIFYPTGEVPPEDAAQVVIFDNSTQAGVLGYHSTTPMGDPYGRVFAETVLQYGGTALAGSMSVSVTLSHEVLELCGDPAANRYALDAAGNLWALELADQVENDFYVVNVEVEDHAGEATTLHPVAVSNYLLPEAFDPGSAGPYDRLSLCTGPFQIRPGGYAIINGQQATEAPSDATDPQAASRTAAYALEAAEHPAGRAARRIESFKHLNIAQPPA